MALTFFLCCWSIVNYISFQVIDPFMALFWVRLVMFFAVPLGTTFFVFIITFPREKLQLGTLKVLVILTYMAITMYACLSSYIFTNIQVNPGSAPHPIVGPGIALFVVLPVLAIIAGIFLLIRKTLLTTELEQKQSLFILAGVTIMFSLIIIFNFIFPTLLGNTQFIPLSSIFTIPFVILTAYAIIKYKLFNVKVITTELITFMLWIFILVRTLLAQTGRERIIDGTLFFITVIVGTLLIKSVMREVEQREELAKLDLSLEDSIKQRESLVHLVTHKVKGSFTRSKYIFAGILDGTFGNVSPEIKKYAEQGLESDNMGIETVDLVLNADNLQKGIVKYDMQKIDFKEIVDKVIEEKNISAKTKGLELKTEIKDENYIMLGDTFWLKEAVNNLIENSIKYTREGKIIVGLKKKLARDGGGGKILFSVKDTGVGITEEDKKNLFTEGGRGKDSVKVNVDSTGYGLYSVKFIVEAHKGRVWAESQGADKGSEFFIELPDFQTNAT
jgi:signal transduction histidine kinase